MFNRTEGLEPERLLPGKKSLATSPPELSQALSYVCRLRACWRPEGRAKLVVPASWTACADNKCGVVCAGDRNCPSRHVRVKTRLVVPAEDVPHDVVSQVLTNAGVADSLARCVSRAFEGTPRTRIQSDVPVKSATFSQSARYIDLVLAPEPAESARHLLLGIDQRHAGSDFEPLPEELIEHGRFHLALLAQRATKTLSGPLPEWLVLFVLVYDDCRLRIIAFVPRRPESDEIDCARYVVDELYPSDASGCVLERLRFLLALRTLRRHVHHLAKSLFTLRDGVRRISGHASCLGRSACNRDALSDSLGSSQYCSSVYSTCPSSVYSRGKSNHESASSGLYSSSCCSTCQSELESASSSDSVYSQESEYMEPSTLSLYQGGDNKNINYSGGLTETRRQAIIAWTQQVTPSEHPVKDDYRMVVSNPHPRGHRIPDSAPGDIERLHSDI